MAFVSHPTWVRGLKHHRICAPRQGSTVAPYMGAWIETWYIYHQQYCTLVAPYMGAWIETTMELWSLVDGMSHPTWVRGLKPDLYYGNLLKQSRTLHGCVDWNITGNTVKITTNVAPYMGAWIETTSAIVGPSTHECRTLHGCVDWNFHFQFFLVGKLSHPTWVRGLKHGFHYKLHISEGVAPYMGAWIETTFKAISTPAVRVAPYMGAWIETHAIEMFRL